MTTEFSWDLSNNANANFNIEKGDNVGGCTINLSSPSHEIKLVLNKRLSKQLTQLFDDYNRLTHEAHAEGKESKKLIQGEKVEPIELHSLGFSRVKHICRLLDIPKSTVWRWSHEGIIPKPVKIFPNVSGWRNLDLAEALATRGIKMDLIDYPIDDRYIDIKEVVAIISVSRSTVYSYAGVNGFPAPIKLGGHTLRWRLKDIVDFVESVK